MNKNVQHDVVMKISIPDAVVPPTALRRKKKNSKRYLRLWKLSIDRYGIIYRLVTYFTIIESLQLFPHFEKSWWPAMIAIGIAQLCGSMAMILVIGEWATHFKDE